MAAPVLPVTFPTTISSTDPVCATESARLLADRIREAKQQMALVLGLPLDTPITQALNFGAGLLGTRNCDCRYVDNTHLLMDADQVMTKSASPGFVVFDNPAAITNDIGLGGPTVNCRDQAAAFPINSFVHFYWIYNGTALGTLSSLAPPFPGPGPVLPTGYFLGAYAGAMLLDATGFLVPGNIRGRWTIYKAARQVFTLATPVTLQAVAVSSCVPANASMIRAQLALVITGPATSPQKIATLFDGLDDEVGSVSTAHQNATSSIPGAAIGVMDAPHYSQILKVTVPAPTGTDVETVTVKVIGFENASGG